MTINKWTFFWCLVLYFSLSIVVFLQLPTEDFGLYLLLYFIFIPFSIITLLGVLIINNINLGVLLYLIISGITFLSPLIGYGFSFHFFIPFNIVSLIIFLITKYSYKDNQNDIKPNISLVLLWFLILFQILFVLFFYSSCASFSDPKLEGGYYMYEELLFDNKDQEYCGVDVSERLSKKTFILSNILAFAYPIYILLLPFFIIKAYYLAFKNRNKDELDNKIPVIRILIGIISLIAIVSLILYLVSL